MCKNQSLHFYLIDKTITYENNIDEDNTFDIPSLFKIKLFCNSKSYTYWLCINFS